MWINTCRHYDHLCNGHGFNHRNRKTGHSVPLSLPLWDHIFFHALEEARIPHTLFPWAVHLAELHRPLLGKHPPPPRARPFCANFSTSRSCCTLVQPSFPTSTSGDHREMLCLRHLPPRTAFIFRLLWLWMRHLTTMPSHQLLYSLQKPFPLSLSPQPTQLSLSTATTLLPRFKMCLTLSFLGICLVKLNEANHPSFICACMPMQACWEEAAVAEWCPLRTYFYQVQTDSCLDGPCQVHFLLLRNPPL